MSIRSVIQAIGFFIVAMFIFACPAQALQRVVYMNGIKTTPEDVEATRGNIGVILSNSSGHIPDKRTFDVAYKWNPLGWYGTESFPDNLPEAYQDIKELFIQKVYEERFFDAYKSMLAYIGYGMTPLSTDTEAATQPFTQILPGYNSLECTQSPPENDGCMNIDRMGSVRSAVTDLMSAGTPSDPAIIVVHSQANLIVNEAYAMLVRQHGPQWANHAMQVVNLANTSRFSVHGLDITHAADDSLFDGYTSLTKLPSSGNNWTRYTPDTGEEDGCGGIAPSLWAACDFKLRGATFVAPANTDDAHSIDKTYLSNKTVSRYEGSLQSGVDMLPSNSTFAQWFEAYVYKAAEALGVQGPNYPASVMYGEKTKMIPSQWLGSAVKTYAADGSWMRLSVNVTNQNYGLVAQSFPYLEGVIRVKAKHKMHAGYDAYGNRRNFFPSIVLNQGSTSINIGFSRSTYPEHYCFNTDYFDKVRITFGSETDCPFTSPFGASALYDSMVPVETTFVFNTRTGEFRLETTSGSALYPERNISTGVVLSTNRLPIVGMKLGTYGWYTGHWHEFYALTVEQVLP